MRSARYRILRSYKDTPHGKSGENSAYKDIENKYESVIKYDNGLNKTATDSDAEAND